MINFFLNPVTTCECDQVKKHKINHFNYEGILLLIQINNTKSFLPERLQQLLIKDTRTAWKKKKRKRFLLCYRSTHENLEIELH